MASSVVPHAPKPPVSQLVLRRRILETKREINKLTAQVDARYEKFNRAAKSVPSADPSKLIRLRFHIIIAMNVLNLAQHRCKAMEKELVEITALKMQQHKKASIKK